MRWFDRLMSSRRRWLWTFSSRKRSEESYGFAARVARDLSASVY
jgi:hypothetical protein